jgi:hypothetical protein
MKMDGKVLTDGYGINEYPGQKLMLEIWKDHLDIRELTAENLYNSTAPNILGGLMEQANKKSKFFLGRTFIGVDDRNGDGLYEILIIFNTLTARQVDAAQTLQSFGAEKVMMLDGGGSTQLRCKNQFLIESERLIPQAVGILPGSALPRFQLYTNQKSSFAFTSPTPLKESTPTATKKSKLNPKKTQKASQTPLPTESPSPPQKTPSEPALTHKAGSIWVNVCVIFGIIMFLSIVIVGSNLYSRRRKPEGDME